MKEQILTRSVIDHLEGSLRFGKSDGCWEWSHHERSLFGVAVPDAAVDGGQQLSV